jgi:hypothetical protein
MKRLIRIAVVAVPLAGCTVTPVTTTGPRPQAASLPGSGSAASERDGVGQGAELPADPAPGSTATRALLIQSQAEREAGDFGGAAATVERALTIAPDEALLWVELAEIRMAQGDGMLAQEMARKALTVTPPNSAVAIRARRLIAR